MVSEATLSTAVAQQAGTAASSTGLAEDFSQFLTLLTIQLQNQDPLSPIETTEFTNQLVAFTGVEQQINTNQRLDSLVALQLAGSLGSTLDYVGLDISYIGNEIDFDGQTSVPINYALDSDANQVTLRILDENGATIFETPGNTALGPQEFIWNGRNSNGDLVEPGTYGIAIDALNGLGNGVGSSVVVTGTVDGVESQNGELFLVVGERAVGLGSVLNASEPTRSSVFDTNLGGDGGSDFTDQDPSDNSNPAETITEAAQTIDDAVQEAANDPVNAALNALSTPLSGSAQGTV